MSRNKSIALIAGATVGLTAMSASAESLDAQRAYNAELMADAETRSSLLQAGGVGYSEDRGFFIGDSNNSLNFQGFSSFRYVANVGSEQNFSGGADGDGVNGFQNVQTQLTFSGNIINPDTHYRIQFDLTDGFEGFAQLEDAWIAYELENGITIAAGQFFVPVAHQEYRVAENRQLSGSRSVAIENFAFSGIKRTQGVFAQQQGENIEWIVGITDGAAASNSSFDTSAAEADFSITARLNYLFSGEWDDFSHASSFRGSEDAAYVGGAFHFQTGGETIATADQDITGFAVDGQYKSDGWQASAQFLFFNIDPATGSESDQIAVVANASYFVSDNWEVTGEFSHLNLDSDTLREDTMNFLTFGGTYYFVPESYAARGIIDVVIQLDETDGISADATRATGVVNSSESGSVAIRGTVEFNY
ncbi:MAG: porin [Planctomycetota bacterium]